MQIIRKFYEYVYAKKLGEVYDAPYDVILDDKNVVQPDILIILQENLHKINPHNVGPLLVLTPG